MGRNSEISAEVRYAITQWPPQAPRGAVAEFCARHGISRKSFYAIRRRALEEGPVAAWSPRSRRPKHSPSRTPHELIEHALTVRFELADDGRDYGPISVMDKMTELGMEAPSRATLARIFTAAGVIDPEPRKRPRSSFCRFVSPAPNGMWQLDGANYPLAYGRQATILQVLDDHSRMILASRAADSENSADVLAVVREAVARHGVPRQFLSDNGVALNPARRKVRSQLVDYLQSLGVKAITGRPGRPTTQGKVERLHRTTAQWLNTRRPPASTKALQVLLDEFETFYNTQRPHQGLPGRLTPVKAWEATPKADPPPLPEEQPQLPPALKSPHGQATKTVRDRGMVYVLGIQVRLDLALVGQDVHITWTPATIEFFDHAGDHLRTLSRPTRPTKYIGSTQPGPLPMS